jgi:hypothetical protein
MKLNSVIKWALRQGLGTKRGAVVIEMLEGPLGFFIDLSTQGKASQELGKLDEAVEALRGLVS